MGTTKERLLEYIDRKGLSIRQFEQKAGLSNGYINNLVSEPSIKQAQKILSAWEDIPPEWLLSGRGKLEVKKEPERKGTRLPYYKDLPATAGRVEQYPALLQCTGAGCLDIPEAKGAEFVLPVVGCSMLPTIKEGEVIGLAHVERYETANADRVYLIVTRDNERMIKRILGYDKERQCLTLASDNPAYPSFELAVELILDVYKVVFHMVIETL